MKRRDLHTLVLALLVSLLLPLMTSSATGGENSSRIPDLEGWEPVEEMFKDLSAPSGHYGTWHHRTFRDPAGRRITVNLFSGAGPGELYVPPEPVSQDDRPIGFGATYRTIQLEGFSGILEYYPYMGYSLALSLPEMSTLCVESGSLSEVQVIRIASELAKYLVP